MRWAAVALLLASAERLGATVPERDHVIVQRICAHLDGLPLAIELAAAKVRAMAVAEIDRRLENRFALLRGGDGPAHPGDLAGQVDRRRHDDQRDQ